MNDSRQHRHSAGHALNELADHIASYLQRGELPRSALEKALRGIGADQGTRADAARALDDAGITIIEDAPVLGPSAPDEPASSVQVQPESGEPRHPRPVRSTADPIDAGRRRLLLDRSIAPSRVQRVLLTAEEEVGLTLLARPSGAPLEPGGFALLTGEQREAADAMFLHNTRLAYSVSRTYVGQGLEEDDLYTCTLPGLIRAIELFDPTSGNKFSTYATWWLRQAVTRTIANEARAIRLPVHMWEKVRRVMATRERLTVEGRRPSLADIADACHLDVTDVTECLRLAPGVVSLETPLGDDQFTLADLVDAMVDVPEQIEVHGLFPEDVGPLLLELKPREADVIRMRFGLAPFDSMHTLDEIGKVYGVTRERIRQIESKAMTGLRRALSRNGHPFVFPEPKKKRAKSDEVDDEAPELAQSA